jgi:hypothetical protein
MPDEAVSLRDINWRETFPFTHLFRAFRVAVHPSKLILALVALGCLWCGGLVLDAIWNHNYEVTPAERFELQTSQTFPRTGRNSLGNIDALAAYEAALSRGDFAAAQAQSQFSQDGTPASGGSAHHPVYGIFHTFFDEETAAANDVLLFRGNPFEAVWRFVAVIPLWLWENHWIFALVYTAWFLLIWSVFGGAISRIAAVHVARDEKISVRHALAFSVGKTLSFIFAPIIPVAIVLGIGIVIAIAAWILLHIPYVGPPIAGLFYCLALLGGFVATLVILGTLGGFNLMYPTVAVEGSDSFDAISRSFSYVFARPWRMLWYTVVAVVYGAICYLFVRFFIWMVLAVTWFFMSWILGPRTGEVIHPVHAADVWPLMVPQPGATANHPIADPTNPLPYTPAYSHLKGSETVAAGLFVWWNYLVIGLIGAFAISFYFSSNTIIYYLMRREVDATELDDVYVEETDDEVEEPAGAVAAAPGAPAGAVIRETTTVRVYETEEGAPAPTPPPASEPSSAAPSPPPPPADQGA